MNHVPSNPGNSLTRQVIRCQPGKSAARPPKRGCTKRALLITCRLEKLEASVGVWG
jgi:hypothetical protein